MKKRLVSLDTFRGITILGMILVNNPGTWGAMYGPLRHAEWHGWTPTDLIFPFFLFIVGVAIVYAFSSRLAAGEDRLPMLKKTSSRALTLFGLGLLLASFPFIQFAPEFGLRPSVYSIRIMGVLQRIAICYFVVTVMFLYLKPRQLMIGMWALLVLYWMAMAFIPVPGHGAGLWDDKLHNLAAWVDRGILGKHLWAGAGRQWDPEGLLSTIPAISTTLMGVWAAFILREDTSEEMKTAKLLVTGFILLTIGYVWDWFFPINKALWTSSYAAFTGGLAMSGLALCYWFIDVKGNKGWTKPFVVYGVNAITVFFLSGIIARTLSIIQVIGPAGIPISLQRWIFVNLFDSWLPTIDASLGYSILWVVAWYFILNWMYKKDIIIKV